MRANVRLLLSLRVLPWRVARFYWRARRHALRSADHFSLASAARPGELAELLTLAEGREAVVELGTGTAWSAIALALDDRTRQIVSYDPSVLAAFRTWREALAPDAVAVFHDYTHPDYPGVREAVIELGLAGEEIGGVFVWRRP